MGFALLAGVCLCGCAPKPQPPTAEQRTAIYERAGLFFTNAVLWKPSESWSTNSLAAKLAPLIIQEVTSTNDAADLWRDRIAGGSVLSSTRSAAESRSRVFVREEKVSLNGRPHDQVSYVWSYPAGSDESPHTLKAQGVRITLNSSGQPAIWEVLADTSKAAIIVVAQSLEAAAAKEFGPALPGRRFSVERSLEEAPNVVVARGIEDGPMVMGPVVYLQAGTPDVGTVICRCMAAQARELIATAEHELAGSTTVRMEFPAVLDKDLRLPRSF